MYTRQTDCDQGDLRPPENYGGSMLGQGAPNFSPEPSRECCELPPPCPIPEPRPPEPPCPPKPPGRGIFGGIFDKFELDDLLLIGILLLLLNDREDSEGQNDLLPLLAMLFLFGFGK